MSENADVVNTLAIMQTRLASLKTRIRNLYDIIESLGDARDELKYLVECKSPVDSEVSDIITKLEALKEKYDQEQMEVHIEYDNLRRAILNDVLEGHNA